MFPKVGTPIAIAVWVGLLVLLLFLALFLWLRREPVDEAEVPEARLLLHQPAASRAALTARRAPP